FAQCIRTERLGEEVDVRIQGSVLGCGVPGVTRHKQHFDSWPQSSQIAGDLSAAHFRQYNVGQQQVDLAAVLLGNLKGAGPVFGNQDAVAGGSEDVLQQKGDR